MIDESTAQISPESTRGMEESNTTSLENSLDSPSPVAESQTPIAEDEAPEEIEEKEPEPKKRAKRKPRWWNSREWTWLQSHKRLAVPLQVVTLECTSERVGHVVKKRIRHGGAWVWKPDADEILKLGKLASCNGVSKINRPFFVGRPSREALEHKPDEPPAEE